MATTTIEGTITKTNGKGFQIAEQEGWLNISKWANPSEAAMPALGAKVMLTLDGSGFVRKITEKASPAVEPAAMPATVDAKDKRITRLAVLNTATSILSSGNRATSAKDVVELAAKLEAWVTR